jgi:predicted DCC family thiol-disulfide oxidoreductase YuxK
MSTSTSTWQIQLLYDGLCPLCLREVAGLRRRDADRGLVMFVDVADDGYDPADHGGVSFEAAMGTIHGVLADGSVVVGVEVFRRVYEVLGLGWVYGVTRIAWVGGVADWLYGVWAERRLWLTGRVPFREALPTSLAVLVAEREARLGALAADCLDDRCQR